MSVPECGTGISGTASGGWALRAMGRPAEAHDLARDSLDRSRRVLGEDRPDTLRSATDLALDLRDLGEVQAARDLDRDTLDRRRRVLSEDHPDTLTSANNLASDLRALGEADDAPDP
jgi:Tetratricopeptide repeat